MPKILLWFETLVQGFTLLLARNMCITRIRKIFNFFLSTIFNFFQSWLQSKLFNLILLLNISHIYKD